MGKYIKKCKATGEIAVMEVAQVGVRMTRSRTAMEVGATSSGTAKRRKICDRELELSAPSVQLRSRRRLEVTHENPVSRSTSCDSRQKMANSDGCASPSSDDFLTSCCSSNGSNKFAKESLKVVDLKEERDEVEASTYDLHRRERKRRETTPSSNLRRESIKLESNEMPSEAIIRRSTAEKMPSEAELEEFFAAAEKQLEKSFTEKYNFDIVNDKPLEGRYEWVRLKP